ncbi:hypothetical protein POM88_001811 [Heracleum sosnowskyi]|uniref:Serine hydroxymethyltransferase-like domain-containing protein n=1 Tax=Heracleum sosnowskyi TaxID=360622 RepID=A0AAD8JGL3_9APIA|nr:hypothetical protein POM88_001789 [Heracleum sosnowskyi]KAK1402189.1 hypothetical protein POM88_001794 [Heracleum sosnowskyi]KAK1402206.1 hypothetical protein POM88_001811 [Heracleum sosnowskyi]
MDPTGVNIKDNDEVEEFMILGHSMCLKRRKDDEGLCSSVSSSRRCGSIDQHCSIELRRTAVKAWGNQSLCVADRDVSSIIEKEKDRQVKGIELIASENFVCLAVMEAFNE